MTSFFLVALCMQVSASGLSQTVSFKGRDVRLRDVFTAIKEQTGYAVVYNPDLLDKAHAVTIDVRDVLLEDLLHAVLDQQSLDFSINRTTIVISRKMSVPAGGPPPAAGNTAANGPVKGRVTGEDGTPLPNINVILKSTGRGVVTDAEGRFTLDVSAGEILIFTSVEYQPKEIKITSSMINPAFAVNIALFRKVIALQDVVINKGYYSTSQKMNTGSITTVRSADIEKQPQADPILSLQGLVPGLYIQQNSGMSAAAISVSIRGTNSVSAGTIPLYIIDGVPFNGQPVDDQLGINGFGQRTNGGSDPFNMINPQDIEKIEVLKDADATAIYGSRGANGVILITTKKGRPGATHLTFSAYTGGGKVSRRVPVLSTAEYLAIRRRAFTNDNITPTPDNAPDLTVWDQKANTDYQKMLIGGTAHTSDVTATLSGGSGQTNFLLSGNFHYETPVSPGASRYVKGSATIKLDHTSANGRLKLDLSVLYAGDNNRIYGDDFANVAYMLPPNFPLYQNGSLYWGGNVTNPLGTLKAVYKTNTDNIVMNATLSYNILSNLQVKLSLGRNNISLDQKILYPGSRYNPAYNSPSTGQYGMNSTKTYIAEPQINYGVTIGKGKLDATVGGSWQATYFNQPLFVIAQGYASDALLDNYSSASMYFANLSTSQEYKYISGFGRLNYAWKEKYILNGTFRRDGSSRFGPDKKFGNFGSIGAAWVFSSESFLSTATWLSFGKLRGSYGIVGNDQISNYGYLDTYSSSLFTYGPGRGFIPTQIANPLFSWEKSRKLEAAVELGFLDNRLNLTGAWFLNRSDNLLINYPLSPQSGFSSYTANLGATVQNSGIELEVKGTPIQKKDLAWTVSFNLSAYRNKLVRYPGLKESGYASRYVLGQPLHIVPLYHFTGFKDGQATVEDANHDGAISPGLKANDQGDYLVAGNLDPKYYGGLTNSLRYKQWTLDLLFNFVKKQGYELAAFPGMLNNMPAFTANTGFKASTLGSSDAYSSYVNYYVNSDARFGDASFIRLRNISLSYALQSKWLRAVKMSNARIYVRAQNLLTFTKYKGLDPETPVYPYNNPFQGVGTFISQPPLKMLTAGIQCTF
jgi:TonB-linked SusC/RagA family outer membrane protein